MKLEELDFDLPRELIAQHPSQKRDEARLLVLDRKTGNIKHKIFRQIKEYLLPGDVLVLNVTRVIPARLRGIKQPGKSKVRVLLLRQLTDTRWEVLFERIKNISTANTFVFDNIQATVVEIQSKNRAILEFNTSINQHLEKIGETPLPPYIKRPDGPAPEDRERYQTIYAKIDGSVAAPTAGFHFTRDLLEEIKQKGVEIAEVLLHIGPGTFKPIKTDTLDKHKMEEEYFEVSEETAKKINQAKQKGRIIAVGTSVCRTLESLEKISLSIGRTNLFIYPPYRFKHIDVLITNFHLPKSTNLALVCAFAGRDLIFKAYQEAISLGYRFYSYGDSMCIL